jgi:hypothetical protein
MLKVGSILKIERPGFVVAAATRLLYSSVAVGWLLSGDIAVNASWSLYSESKTPCMLIMVSDLSALAEMIDFEVVSCSGE